MTFTLAVAAALLLQAPAQAPGKLRWVPNPTRTTRGWVSDPARHLRPATVAAIDSVIFALERETSAEMAVVVIDSLDGLEPADAALLLHRRWGVGKRDRNNGLVFLWSPALRKLHVSVGYRLEGVLPDARVGRILDEVVLPRFRADSFDLGVLNGVKALAAATREEVAWNAGTGVPAYHPELAPEVVEAPVSAQPLRGAPTASTPLRRDRGNPLPWLLGAAAAILGAVTWIFRRRHRPPACPRGHGAMTRLDEQHEDARLSPEERVEEQLGSIDYDVWTCARCDAVVVKPWTKWFSGYTRCDRCRRLTVRTTERTLRSATTMSEGLVEVTKRCGNCGAYDVRTHTTPRIVPSSSSSSSGSSFGGGGGGGGGSSFGGGSAGGGGAGRSY
jgi:uncharacterized protein